MVRVREAVFSDYSAIAKLHTQSWRENYRGIYSDAFLDEEVEHNRIAEWFTRFQLPAQNQRIFIAEGEGARERERGTETIAGFACLYLDDDPVYGSLVDNLHVSKALKKSGIGRTLLKECANAVALNAIQPHMYLWVFEMNIDAHAFYYRMGGELVETVEKENNDGTMAMVCRIYWNRLGDLK